MFFIIEKTKETRLDFSKVIVKVFRIYFALIQYLYKMTQYNTLNVKLANSQLNKLKSEINNGTEVVLNFSSNVIILIMRLIFHINKLKHKFHGFIKILAMVHQLNIKLSKIQLPKLVQLGRLLSLLGSVSDPLSYLNNPNNHRLMMVFKKYII